MSVTVEATYERGVLRLSQPLPLDEHETVRVTVHSDKVRLTRDNAARGCSDSAGAAQPEWESAAEAKRPGLLTKDNMADLAPDEGEMLNIFLEIPPSPTARTLVLTRGEPILPGPFQIDESDLAPE